MILLLCSVLVDWSCRPKVRLGGLELPPEGAAWWIGLELPPEGAVWWIDWSCRPKVRLGGLDWSCRPKVRLGGLVGWYLFSPKGCFAMKILRYDSRQSKSRGQMPQNSQAFDHESQHDANPRSRR